MRNFHSLKKKWSKGKENIFLVRIRLKKTFRWPKWTFRAPETQSLSRNWCSTVSFHLVRLTCPTTSTSLIDVAFLAGTHPFHGLHFSCWRWASSLPPEAYYAYYAYNPSLWFVFPPSSYSPMESTSIAAPLTPPTAFNNWWPALAIMDPSGHTLKVQKSCGLGIRWPRHKFIPPSLDNATIDYSHSIYLTSGKGHLALAVFRCFSCPRAFWDILGCLGMSQDALGLLKHLKTARARWPFPDASSTSVPFPINVSPTTQGWLHSFRLQHPEINPPSHLQPSNNAATNYAAPTPPLVLRYQWRCNQRCRFS